MWEAWFSLACLGTFRSLKIICGLHGIGYLETWFSQQPSGHQAHGIILSWPCLRRKRWNGNLPLDTDWASSWVYDYWSVRPCCLLAGRLGTNCLTSLRFSVPGYSNTPLLVVLKIKWYNPYKALGQSLSGSKCLLSPSFFTPRSSEVLDLWQRTQTGGRSDLSWNGKGGWEYTQKLAKDTSYQMGFFFEEVTWVFE